MRHRLWALPIVICLSCVALVLAGCGGPDPSEAVARDFLEAVRAGDQATYDQLLIVPSSEDTATAAGIANLANAISDGYEIDHVTPLVDGFTAVFVHITNGDSDPGFFGALVVSDTADGRRVDYDFSSALHPGTFPSTDPAAWLKSGGLELASIWNNTPSGGSTTVTYGSAGTGRTHTGSGTATRLFSYSIKGNQVTVVFQDSGERRQVFEVTKVSGSTFTNSPIGAAGSINHGTWTR